MTDTSTYYESLKRQGNPDSCSPAYLRRVALAHCDEAARRFCDDPERVNPGMRNFLIRASHYWHGEVQELVQVNASRERIMEVFAECQSWNGIELDVCEELLRFKLATPAERNGIKVLLAHCGDCDWPDEHDVDQALALLRRCSQGYGV